MPRRTKNTNPSRLIGRRLSQLRAAHGWTQARMAEALGLPPSSMSRIENGERTISVEHLLRAATVLGVPPVDILGGPLQAPAAEPSEERSLVAAFARLGARQRRLVVALVQELAATNAQDGPSDGS